MASGVIVGSGAHSLQMPREDGKFFISEIPLPGLLPLKHIRAKRNVKE